MREATSPLDQRATEVTRQAGASVQGHTAANDLDKRLHNANGFPKDSWPAPQIDLSDGRVHPDGTLDWHVKTS
jgi:hypothetical protein